MQPCALDIIPALAGIAQLVERNLAKVEVASSRLVSRSRSAREGLIRTFPVFRPQARWQSGHAAACKAVDAGSIPTPASSPLFALHFGNNTGPRGSRIASPMVPAGGGFVSVLSTF